MEALRDLLDNYMIVKEADRDLYYEVKDNLSNFKIFIQDKLGYNVVIHQDFIKMEKFPGTAEPWMGVQAFEEIEDYCFFVIVIMYLEDKGKEEQFVLSQLLEYISGNYGDKLDWTVYSTRRSLVRVLKFATQLRIIKINDGNEGDFSTDEQTEVLYENTGISKYIIRTFPTDIMEAKSYQDFIDFAWEDMDRARGALRKHRVYRTLTLSPALYNNGTHDQDFYYVKNYKGIIENDMDKYLGWNLHVHKDGAMVVLGEDQRCKQFFPSTGAVSDITLNFNKKVVELIKLGRLNPNVNSLIKMKLEEFKDLLSELREEKSVGWSKEYRECSPEHLFNNLTQFMIMYNMLKVDLEDVTIYPLIGKVVGDYPDDYREGNE